MRASALIADPNRYHDTNKRWIAEETEMTTISEGVEAGRSLAVEMTLEAEPAVSRYVAATRVDYDTSTGLPTCFNVSAKFRSAHRYFYGEQYGFGAPSVDEIATIFVGWIRGAIERNWLIADGAAA